MFRRRNFGQCFVIRTDRLFVIVVSTRHASTTVVVVIDVVIVAHEGLVEVDGVLASEFRSRLDLNGAVSVDGVTSSADVFLVAARRSLCAV